MPEVFISYSQKDRDLVAPIAGRLAELGVEVWFDRDLQAGERFGAVIRQKLKESKAVLTCWSPSAIESEWVDSEADFARELGTYVPVLIAPCALLPPFNRIHTEDLSAWKGDLDNATWLKLCDRFAQLLRRPGLAAAARALAKADEQGLYKFAKRFPDEPVAQQIWRDAEAQHRQLFCMRLADARTESKAWVETQQKAIETQLQTLALDFEKWLNEERRGTTESGVPNPHSLVDQLRSSDITVLRKQVTDLFTSLATERARVNTLVIAKGENERLKRELAIVKSSRLPARTWTKPFRVSAILLAAMVGAAATCAWFYARRTFDEQPTLTGSPPTPGEERPLQSGLPPDVVPTSYSGSCEGVVAFSDDFSDKKVEWSPSNYANFLNGRMSINILDRGAIYTPFVTTSFGDITKVFASTYFRNIQTTFPSAGIRFWSTSSSFWVYELNSFLSSINLMKYENAPNKWTMINTTKLLNFVARERTEYVIEVRLEGAKASFYIDGRNVAEYTAINYPAFSSAGLFARAQSPTTIALRSFSICR